MFSREQVALLREEINLKESIEFFSQSFSVPKKNGKRRPVINVKCLNQWVESPHLNMEGIPTLQWMPFDKIGIG